jgi:lambda family phage portal protein
MAWPFSRRAAAPVARIDPPLPAVTGGRGASSQYMRGDSAPVFLNWHPPLRESREDARAAYIRAAARAIDSIHNSGWLAGAVKQRTASAIGTGLRCAAKPDWQALGWTQEQGNDWARTVERRFGGWACEPLECDAAGKQSLDQMATSALNSQAGTGEILGLVQWIDRAVSQSRTKIKLLPATRLVQESNGTDLFQGVRVDTNGLPTSYRLRLDSKAIDSTLVTEVAARDETGRPRVFHIFDGEVGQMRGLSPFTPVLKVVRQSDHLQDYTLTAALVQSMYAATLQSDLPTEAALASLQTEAEQDVRQGLNGGSLDDWLGAQIGWGSNANIDLYGPGGAMGRVVTLFPGQKLEFTRSEHPNDTYEAFLKWLLREVARCLGMSFESFTGDYTSATYSSVRMSGSEIWPIILWLRIHIAGRFYQTAYEAWLEEDIEAGFTPFPGGIAAFHARRAAACRADWRGPPKPQADDLKYAKAVEILFNLGLMTAEQVCAELGSDWEDSFEQSKRELDLRTKLGLPAPVVSKRDTNTGDEEKDAA